MKYVITILCCFLINCELAADNGPVSASGVGKANVQVQKGTDSLTVEQRNVRDRLLKDNEPGAIKHLYLISPLSGEVLLYSTVRGKVTSSGKRLTPNTVQTTDCGSTTPCGGFNTQFGNANRVTNEVLADDGTYGSSGEYIFWWDVRGTYHQQYLVSGGVVIHVSDQPLAVKHVVLNLEVKSIP